MRIFLCLLLALSGVLAAVSQADARPARNSHSRVYGYQSYSNGRGYNTAPRYYKSPYTDTQECIQARDVDPSGNYASYPCWAQWALSPKGRNR